MGLPVGPVPTLNWQPDSSSKLAKVASQPVSDSNLPRSGLPPFHLIHFFFAIWYREKSMSLKKHCHLFDRATGNLKPHIQNVLNVLSVVWLSVTPPPVWHQFWGLSSLSEGPWGFSASLTNSVCSYPLKMNLLSDGRSEEAVRQKAYKGRREWHKELPVFIIELLPSWPTNPQFVFCFFYFLYHSYRLKCHVFTFWRPLWLIFATLIKLLGLKFMAGVRRGSEAALFINQKTPSTSQSSLNLTL